VKEKGMLPKSEKKKSKKGDGLKRTASLDSLNSSSTEKSADKSADKSHKKKKSKKMKKDSMFERNSFGESGPQVKRGSIEEGREMFAWIIDPVSLEDFFT
jgi:hypothetical protein